MLSPPEELRTLYSEDEWATFEKGVRRWLGEASTVQDSQLLCVDDALLVPSAYTYAVAVKDWMARLGMNSLAARIVPDEYSDAFTAQKKGA